MLGGEDGVGGGFVGSSFLIWLLFLFHFGLEREVELMFYLFVLFLESGQIFLCFVWSFVRREVRVFPVCDVRFRVSG